MRLPLALPLQSRDGTVEAGGRLQNTLIAAKGSRKLAELRPGLVFLSQTTGTGNGMVALEQRLISVTGTTIRSDTVEIATVVDGIFDFAQGAS